MHIAALNIEIVATVSIRAGNDFSRILKCLDRSLSVKAVVAAFNQEKALVGAFSDSP